MVRRFVRDEEISGSNPLPPKVLGMSSIKKNREELL